MQNPTHDDRHPGLTAHGAELLKRMREHPAAPLFRNHSGHRLLPMEVDAVRQHSERVRCADIEPRPHFAAWLPAFLKRVREQVPYWRLHAPGSDELGDWPTTSRANFAADIAAFVPDDLSLDRVINFRTTGSTGHPLLLPSHPVVAARYLSYHQRAYRRLGVELTAGRGQVGVLLIGWQQKCFTYTSVTPYRDDCGLAKINLHPVDWRHLSDRGAYIDALAPEVIAGDPLSLAVLLEIEFEHRPKILLSTSMQLLPGLRHALEARFKCVVADVYSLNEAGPIAAYENSVDGHMLLQPELVVEILDANNRPPGIGEAGDVVLTGGFNDYLPLVRYRTGDTATLERVGGEFVLRRLLGRQPVRIRRANGSFLNNIDITHALADLPIAQFSLHQRVDGDLDFTVQPGPGFDLDETIARLNRVLGSAKIRAQMLHKSEGKLWQYRSDIVDSLERSPVT